MNDRDRALQIAIDVAGSSISLARLIGVTPQAISQWTRVPAERVLQVENATGVPREALRPDIYPPNDFLPDQPTQTDLTEAGT